MHAVAVILVALWAQRQTGRNENRLEGNVMFIFQPAKRNSAGRRRSRTDAKRRFGDLIAENDEKVFGIHVGGLSEIMWVIGKPLMASMTILKYGER